MQSLKKALLSMASILGLAAGTQTSAGASPIPQDTTPTRSVAGSVELTTDPIFEFVAITKGTFSEKEVLAALKHMFKKPSHEQVHAFPRLYSDLSNLGMSPKVLKKAKEKLIELTSASKFDKAFKASVISELKTGRTLLAQQQRRRQPPPPPPGELGHERPGGGGYK